MLASKSRRLEESGLVTRVCVHIVRHALVLISLLADAGLSFASAQMKLDATYTATLLGLPIGQMSWTVEIHDNRFESVAKGAISGFLRLFLDVQGEVTAHGALSGGKPVASNFSQFFPVAGYDPNHFLVTYLAAQHDTEIWLAPLAGSRLVVPYRALISTPMGLGILQATKFEFAPSQLA